MILALLLSLAPAFTQADVPPAITVQLNHERFSRGDRARVYVETAQDGYLIVLHADPDGRVRVLFPLDPTDDDFVRGGRRQELRGRSGRDAFLVDAEDGSGTVLAAVARDPLTFDAFVRGDHWDYRALGGPSLRDDPLAGLLDIVRRMGGGGAGETRFDYDAATYVVNPQIASRYGYGHGYGSRFGLGLSFGYPHRYSYFRDPFYDPFYDPFCFDAFWGWGAGCNRYGYGYGSGYSFYRPRLYGYGYRPVFIGGGFARGGGSRFVIPSDRGGRGRYTPVVVRPRGVSGDPAPVRDRGAVSRGVDRRPSVAPRGDRGVSRGQPGSARGKPSVSRGGGRGDSRGSRPAARPSGGRRSGGGGGGGGGRRN